MTGVVGNPGPDMAAEAVLRASDLQVRYGALQVLWGVSLEVRPRETVCLLGPNGAGKSTVVNAISGLVPLDAGEVWFDGARIDRLPTHERAERGIAHVLERRHVFPYMTVAENLDLGAYGQRGSSVRSRQLPIVYDLFPRLAERRTQLADTLSGGEQQMLAIGRGLMSYPKLLILDEPFIGLSPLMITTIVEVVQAVNEMDVSVLFIEQNVAEALACSARGYVLEAGRVALAGDSNALAGDARIREVYLGAI